MNLQIKKNYRIICYIFKSELCGEKASTFVATEKTEFRVNEIIFPVYKTSLLVHPASVHVPQNIKHGTGGVKLRHIV